MRIQIEITTNYSGLTGCLMGNPYSLSAGQTRESLLGGADLIWKGEDFAKSAGELARVVHFAIEFGPGVASSLVAQWIWEKLRALLLALRNCHCTATPRGGPCKARKKLSIRL